VPAASPLALAEQTMKRATAIKRAILVVLFVLLIGSSLSTLRYKGHNQYHRSKMVEIELLSRISMHEPVGTPLQKFLDDFNLKKDVYHKLDESSGIISIRPDLRIPKSEWRDYTGFSFTFKDGRLVGFKPNGPQPPEYEVDLKNTDIGKRIYTGKSP
jgi:hypothetical protein